MTNRLKHLTIKPTHKCTNNCPYCTSRRKLLDRHSGYILNIDEWTRVFTEANSLGTDYLDISGGDPTLYKDLPALIWEGKRRGWFVSMNSTGFNLAQTIHDLTKVCLDQAVISFLSLNPRKNNEIRQIKGDFNYTLQAIELLRENSIRTILHFIINRYNYHELPELIDFAFDQNVNGLALIYPEGDHELYYLLMNKAEISDFKQNILPICLDKYVKYRPDEAQSFRNLKNLFVSGDNSDFSKGIYWPNLKTACDNCTQPNRFALVYPDGSVLPCNGIEYLHEPVVGNVREQSLTEIWENMPYNNFRKDRTDFCRFCPVKRHTGLAIGTNDNPPYAAEVVKRIPENLPEIRPNRPLKNEFEIRS